MSTGQSVAGNVASKQFNNAAAVQSLQHCTIIYDVVGRGFCLNANRMHKSNHIYIVANIHEKSLYQKCYDPDCKHFRSNPLRIPDLVLDNSLLEDNDLLNCVDNAMNVS
jgi:hypothetical protein